MPRSPSPKEDMFQQSVRFDNSQAPWLQEQAGQAGSLSAVLRALVDDARSWYNLAPHQVARLEAEAKELRLDRRDYIKNLLSLHAEQLAMEEASGSPRSKRPGYPPR